MANVALRRREAKLRRALRPETIGVDVIGTLNLVGALLKWLALAALFPTAIALGYGEPFWPFLAAGGDRRRGRLGARAGHGGQGANRAT